MHNTLDDSVWTVTTYAQKKWYILLLTVLCLAEWSLFLHKPNLFLFPPKQIFSVLRSSNGEIQTDFAKRLFWVSYFWRKLPSSSFVPQFSRDWIFVWEKICRFLSQLFGTDQFGVVTFIIQGVNLEEYLNIKLMLPDLRRCGPHIGNNVLYNLSLTIENHLFFMYRWHIYSMLSNALNNYVLWKFFFRRLTYVYLNIVSFHCFRQI